MPEVQSKDGERMRYFTLIFFLTLAGYFGYSAETLTVTRVEKGIVTMGDYTIPEHEAWREGDKAEVIIREGEIILERWRR